MKRLCPFILYVIIAATAVAYAHGGNDHVRGVVTSISAKSITVQTGAAPTATKTLTLTGKTTFQLGGKPAHLEDVKVGQRVVIDVPEKSSEALLIQIGVAQQPQQSSTPKPAAPKPRATGPRQQVPSPR